MTCVPQGQLTPCRPRLMRCLPAQPALQAAGAELLTTILETTPAEDLLAPGRSKQQWQQVGCSQPGQAATPALGRNPKVAYPLCGPHQPCFTSLVCPRVPTCSPAYTAGSAAASRGH